MLAHLRLFLIDIDFCLMICEDGEVDKKNTSEVKKNENCPCSIGFPARGCYGPKGENRGNDGQGGYSKGGIFLFEKCKSRRIIEEQRIFPLYFFINCVLIIFLLYDIS